MNSSDSNLTLSWKRPWTIEEIIQSSQSWSLAADSGVCELLKSLSTDLLNEVAQVNNNINELSVESKQTNVIIQNAFNEFCMLANNQFMENLVEDVASCPITNENIKNNTESNPSKEEKLAQIIPQVTESLKMGLQVLENQFEIMDMQKVATTANQEESDNEMRSYAQVDYLTNEPIYHPKDPYENRHLPHLIGTKAFIEDDTLGIGYLDDLEIQSESDSARSENASISGDLTSSITDNPESDDNEDKPSAIRKISSSESGGMFTDDGQSDKEDLFTEDKPINSIKSPNTSTNTNTNTNTSLARPLSLMDQLNNQLNKRFNNTENIDKTNEQMENSFSDDDNQENQLSPPVNHRSEDLKKQLPFQASPNIMRRVSGNSADEDSDDLFGDYSTKNMKTEAKPVSSSITQMPPVVTSTPSNVDKKSDVKQKDKPISKKSSNPLFDSDSDELFPREPAVPKPVVRSKKSNLNSSVKDSIGDRHGKTENPSPKEAPTKIITPNKKPAPPVESDDDDDDLFGPQVSKPAISTVPAVKPISKPNNLGLFSSDDDADLFNAPTRSKPLSKMPDKSNEATNLPKVEPDKKMDTKAPKNETTVPKPFSSWLDSSSDEDILKELPKSKNLVISKPLKELNHDSIKEENSEIKVQETIKSDDIKEITQTNNSNSSANNLEEFNEDKNIEDFDNLFITNRKENVSIESNKVLNDSKKDSDPFALPKRKISFNISDNSDEDYSNKLPVIIPRSNLTNTNQKSSAGSGVLDASSPENLNPNLLDIASDVKSSRESLPKLPPGAKPLFGPSLMNEMRSHQKSRLSLNSESEADIKDASHLFTPDKIDLLGSFESQTESNAQSNKQDFKNKLQLKLNEKSFMNPAERVNKPEMAEENGIDLEIPPEEVHQLNLLTKSRVKANPRRRPTTKKAGNEDTIPTSDPVIPDTKTNSIPQPNVDSVPIVTSNQSDDTSNIFADLPSKPIKKSKSNKKPTTSTNKTKKTVEVNVEEIDDIFSMATPKPKKAKNKSKIVSDPLGAL